MLDGRSFYDMSHSDILTCVDETVKISFCREPEVVYFRQRGSETQLTWFVGGTYHRVYSVGKIEGALHAQSAGA